MFENHNIDQYNELLTSTFFWNLFVGSKILIWQDDSCIFGSNINDFIKWDYIGSPWIRNDNQYGVGNGGLSASATFYLKENNLRYIMVTRSNWDYLSTVKDRVILNCTPVTLNTVHKSNTVIDFNIGQVSGDKLHLLQAKEQFTLYTGLKYGT